ncbi:MAG: hypothetical protein U1C12_02650 [Patescibacteria group bacterium]|nr:hypothetical protein [Patescibacteria group bacterium]
MPNIFSSEHTYSYKNYTFGYALYAQRLGDEPINLIYAAGFLPYSGENKSQVNSLYYMARSARVKLSSFLLSSENRRIQKKFRDYNFHSKEYPASMFLKNEEMLNFCLRYFEKRHGPNLISKERLKRILGFSPETKVVEYKNQEGSPCAYIIEIQSYDFTHYWFSFYDLSLVYQSLGMWLMIDRVENAKKKKKKYCYLGTVYGDRALYKTNIPSIEYWNGEKWVADVNSLKNRARTDENRVVSQIDEFKMNNED